MSKTTTDLDPCHYDGSCQYLLKDRYGITKCEEGGTVWEWCLDGKPHFYRRDGERGTMLVECEAYKVGKAYDIMELI